MSQFNEKNNKTLESRLMDYIEQKKYYEQYGIEDDMLEKKYNISEKDVNKITSYLHRHGKHLDINIDNVQTDNDFIDIMSSKFPSDNSNKNKYMEKIMKKQQKIKDVKQQCNNYNSIRKNYDMYRDDRQFSSASGDDFKTSGFDPSEWFNKNTKNSYIGENNRLNEDVMNMTGTKSYSETNTYTNPKSNYNGYIGNNVTVNDDPHSIDAIMNKIDDYKNRDNTTELREFENNYKQMSYTSGNKKCDVSADTYVKFGTTPSRSMKSLGYPSVAEHSFSYISDDIQNPDHVVNDRGMSTRLDNKGIARNHVNKIMFN